MSTPPDQVHYGGYTNGYATDVPVNPGGTFQENTNCLADTIHTVWTDTTHETGGEPDYDFRKILKDTESAFAYTDQVHTFTGLYRKLIYALILAAIAIPHTLGELVFLLKKKKRKCLRITVTGYDQANTHSVIETDDGERKFYPFGGVVWRTADGYNFPPHYIYNLHSIVVAPMLGDITYATIRVQGITYSISETWVY